MEEIYLIGKLYDDFSDRGFCVLSVATTEVQAKILKHYYEDILFADDDDDETIERREEHGFNIEIRAFQTNIAEPVGEIITHECTYKNVKFKRQEVMPYRVIK